MFLQLLVGGIVVGCIYALIGLGYSLIYSASGLMSFVQGEIFMLGAYVAFTMYVGLKIPFLLAVLVAIAIMFVFGMLMERSMISPLLRRGAEQIHILADLVRVRVFESGSVLAELSGHAGHGDLAHAVAAGCGEAFGDEVADTDEGGCGQLRQVDLRAGFGAPASAEDHCRTAGKKVRFHADADGIGFMAVGTDQAGGA